jgi:acyl-CoA synthetase (AMP-forming)/AMP-acid ligase II
VLGLAKHPVIDKFDLSSLKGLMSGAAPLGAEIQKLCEARLGCCVKQAWGMTELSPAASIMPDNWLREKGSDFCGGSVGLLLPGTEAKLVHPDTGVVRYNDHMFIVLFIVVCWCILCIIGVCCIIGPAID